MSSNDSLLGTVLLVLLALLLFPVLMMVFAMPLMGMTGFTHMSNGMWSGTGGWVAWLVAMLVPLLVLVGIGYVAYRLLGSYDSQRSDDAIEELRRAYARGDISDEEFENRLERLRNE